LRMATMLAPVLRFYQILLYPVAKPVAKALDAWLGTEGIQYFREHSLREVIQKHIEADESDVDRLEGIGALNFLAIDDLLAADEGEHIDPDSIVPLEFQNDLPVFPSFEKSTADPFLKQVEVSKKKWVILTDATGEPHFALDSDAFLRGMLFEGTTANPIGYCHRPVIVKDPGVPLGNVLCQLKECVHCIRDDVIDQDVILVWGPEEKRVITGADILGRLLKGV